MTGEQLRHPPRCRECGVAAAVAAVCLALGLVRTSRLTPEHPGFTEPADHHKYIHMAEHGPRGFYVAPFCHRIGVPMLARWLPVPARAGFLLIAGAGVAATAMVVYLLCRSFGFAPNLALLDLVLFFSMGWATRYPIHDFWLPDAAALFLTTLAIWCCRARRPLLLTMALACGVLVKESVLVAAPLALTLGDHASPFSKRVAWFFAAALPAIAILVALRFAIPARNDDPAYVRTLSPTLAQIDQPGERYDDWSRFEQIARRRLGVTLSDLHAYSVGTFGMLPLLLPLFDLRRNLRLLVRFLPFVLPVYLQLLLATDTQRLLILAFPVIILMSLGGVERLTRVRGVRPEVPALLVVALLGLNLLDPQRIAAPVRLQAAFIAVAAVAAWLTRREADPALPRASP